MKKYKCRVCGKRFDDLMVHLHRDEKKLLKEKPTTLMLGKNDIKPSHLKEYERIENSIDYKLKRKRKCFCGGEIEEYSFGDSRHYETGAVCLRCFFIWGR